jgi:hypothetical protein
MATIPGWGVPVPNGPLCAAQNAEDERLSRRYLELMAQEMGVPQEEQAEFVGQFSGVLAVCRKLGWALLIVECPRR